MGQVGSHGVLLRTPKGTTPGLVQQTVAEGKAPPLAILVPFWFMLAAQRAPGGVRLVVNAGRC